MDMKRLEQYAAIKKEIAYLEGRIATLQGTAVADSVTGSSPDFPYRKQVVRIEGDSAAIAALSSRLRLRQNTLSQETLAIEAFVDTINDSTVRQIIQLRYLEGHPWAVVAEKVFGYKSEDVARKKISRFLSK